MRRKIISGVKAEQSHALGGHTDVPPLQLRDALRASLSGAFFQTLPELITYAFSFILLHCCFTSTEARWLIRDGDRVGRGRQSEGSTAETVRKRPERPWTAARTMKVLRRCPLAIAQRLVHCAIAVSTAVLGQSQRQCPLHSC